LWPKDCSNGSPRPMLVRSGTKLRSEPLYRWLASRKRPADESGFGRGLCGHDNFGSWPCSGLGTAGLPGCCSRRFSGLPAGSAAGQTPWASLALASPRGLVWLRPTLRPGVGDGRERSAGPGIPAHRQRAAGSRSRAGTKHAGSGRQCRGLAAFDRVGQSRPRGALTCRSGERWFKPPPAAHVRAARRDGARTPADRAAARLRRCAPDRAAARRTRTAAPRRRCRRPRRPDARSTGGAD